MAIDVLDYAVLDNHLHVVRKKTLYYLSSPPELTRLGRTGIMARIGEIRIASKQTLNLRLW
jgi:hypothetical protein